MQRLSSHFAACLPACPALPACRPRLPVAAPLLPSTAPCAPALPASLRCLSTPFFLSPNPSRAGALDEEERLTTLGRHLAALPLPPALGKLLLLGVLWGCLDPVLTAACFVSYRQDP